MIIVIVITGIIGGIVAVFLKAPMQQYVDVARRADLTDIADTALRRISRDLRLSLPNSVRVAGASSGAGSCNGVEACFIEFLPVEGGGRYRVAAAPSGTPVCPGDMADDTLDFDASDTCFEVLGPMQAISAGGQIVIYNLGIPGSDAYAGNTSATHNRRAASNAGNKITLISTNKLPFDSPGRRFYVVSTPVSYACDGAGTLWRYWGYPIQDVQAKTDSIAELDALIPNSGYRAKLATKVKAGGCRFKYEPNAVASHSGLVTMHLGITEAEETVTLYNVAYVNNMP